MREYLLLLPIIFIFHDMEEIVGFGWFFRKNMWLFDKYPRVTAMYRDTSEMAWKIGVYEEFVPFFGVSLWAYYFPSEVIYAVWFGFFLDLTAHFIVHILFSVVIKKYIPSLITSIICLPVSVLILYKCSLVMTFDGMTVFFTIIGIILMIINFAFLKWFIPILSKKLIV